MSKQNLPLGKLPASLLSKLLEAAPTRDPQVVIGPGVGLDCAVIEFGDRLLVLKSDPITFTTETVGQYLVQINANDVATTGGRPRWLLLTLLLPEGKTTEESASELFRQVVEAADPLGITLIGGHTEITHGIDRVLAIGTLIGEVEKRDLVTPRGALPGHRILLSKGLAIEATAIAAREFADRLRPNLTDQELQIASDYLTNPGISIVRDVQIAMKAGRISAMHDPTEGGLASALWELAVACGHTLIIHPELIQASQLTRKICQILEIDPMFSISSGALLLTAPSLESKAIKDALCTQGIQCADIGYIEQGLPEVYSEEGTTRTELPWPQRDEITRLFES
jgi:hydrogenase expression/formation protein HypE